MLGQMPRSLGIRDQPKEQPGPAQVNDRKSGANGQRENRDHLRASRHRPSPSSIREAQDSGDQRACVAQSDPENEIRDVESPKNRPVKPGDSNAAINLQAKRSERRNYDSGEERNGKQIPCRTLPIAGASGLQLICSGVFCGMPGIPL